EVWANLTQRFERNELYNDRYQGPELHVSRITVSGPISNAEKPTAYRFLFGVIEPGATNVSSDLLQQDLCRVATAVFRRPVEKSEIERHAASIELKMAGGLKYSTAAAPAFKALICSPDFLFLVEKSGGTGELSAWQLATRLAYFLWSSTPDDQLVARAADE